MSLLCMIGLHRKVCDSDFKPSIVAEVVTEYTIKVYCHRCGKVFETVHQVWNADTEDYEDAREG